MHPVHIYPVKPSLQQQTNPYSYQQMYEESIQEPQKFWQKHGQIIDWMRPFSQVKNTSFQLGKIQIEWFADGELNACVNCVDRHLPERGEQTALIWEGDLPEQQKQLSFKELHLEVCRCANILKMLGVKRGDVVAIYMPMLAESCVAMLACARIGAVHAVVFGGFSAESLATRINDCEAKVLITADGGYRGGRLVPLKDNADRALEICQHEVDHVLVWQHTRSQISWTDKRDLWWHKALLQVDDHCQAERMGAEDPLFILYTSGSTGQPKGILHTTGGYLVYAAMTFKYIFDHQASDVYWSTADIGWITGHTYLVYGPLANAATTLVYEGIPTFPTDHRLGEIIDRHQVTLFYTAPTLIRALMAKQDLSLEATQRTSLRVMGSVGEPINPEAWEWYYQQFGNEKAAIMDTWWQTETGGVLITPLPGVHDLKAGAALRPFFGVQPAIVNQQGEILEGPAEGALVILDSWPGQMRTVYGDQQRFEQVYFEPFANMYFSGDGARRDADGDYWITGRVDDVINVSGHRLGTAEIETAIDAHERVAEAAVVGVPHPIKGQAIYAYVILNYNEIPDQCLEDEIKAIVRQEIGAFAIPESFHWTQGLPKTRSGKIMRRILRKIAAGDFRQLGDISTLADPSVVEHLIRTHMDHSQVEQTQLIRV